MTSQTDRWGQPIRDVRWFLGKLGWAVLGLVAVGLAAFVVVSRRDREPPKAQPIDGYQHNVDILTREYGRFHGRLLRDPELERQFQMAGELVSQHKYSNAIELLENVSKTAAVPVVFNNLGALYATVNDRSRAIIAYREALARDPEYRPVRESFDRLRIFTFDEAAPVRQEIEPNNSDVVANLISLLYPADGEIGVGDVDTFKFIVPEPPRDILQLDVENLGRTFELGIRVHDEGLANDSGRVILGAGESIRRYVSQPPNTPIFLQVWGAHDTAGKYQITLKALKSFDALEPNDDIFTARRVDLGTAYEANIMDSEDTDYYSFESGAYRSVTIGIKNESSTLIPAVTTFSADRRNTGFGPDVRRPGDSLSHTMEVQEHRTYFVQVWSQAHTSGRYTLTIEGK